MTYLSRKILCKFCTLGMVTSKKWYLLHIIIDNEVIYIYNSEE